MQFVYQSDISRLLLITVIIIFVAFEYADSPRVPVAKERNGIVRVLLQVKETYGIAKRLDGIQDSVGSRKRLHETVLLQIFIHPKGVERGGVKPR